MQDESAADDGAEISRNHDGRVKIRRRDVLRTTAAVGAASGLSGCLDVLSDDADDDGASPATDDLDLDGSLGDGEEPTGELIPEGPTVRLEPVADGFAYPTDLTSPPGDPETLFVTDILGQVYRIADGERELWLDVSDQVIDVEGNFSERGLLGIEFHPDYADNGRFYLRYSGVADDLPEDFTHVEYLSEFVAEDGIADPSSENVVLAIEQPFIVHNSGNIVFGPDGYLYVPTGDGGDSLETRPEVWYDESPGSHGQDTRSALLGGILRIDVDGDDPYEIPPDNPLVGEDDHRNEYYAWGFRNPWGAAFDGDTLYVADVGQVLFETVNLVEKGGNYGWNVTEGTSCYNAENAREPLAECPDETPAAVRGGEQLRDPVIEYPQEHDGTAYGSAVIGGYVYRGDEIPALDGTYVFGDWSRGAHEAADGALYAATAPGDDSARHDYNEERDLWQIYELVVQPTADEATDIGEGGDLNRFVASFGRAGEDLYVLTTATNEVEGETGTVHRLAPPE